MTGTTADRYDPLCRFRTFADTISGAIFEIQSCSSQVSAGQPSLRVRSPWREASEIMKTAYSQL
jgi:hypothetical protein